MVDTFTLNQLVRYTYRECSSAENEMIQEMAQEDLDIQDEIKELKTAMRNLPKALFSAKARTLQNILDYSKK
ncbi:MAG TPA: hypothetical protein PK006_03535 [Saprospiraceae bacterium]|nr:hypothetical protein [Saprospiraceae bacterium]